MLTTSPEMGRLTATIERQAEALALGRETLYGLSNAILENAGESLTLDSPVSALLLEIARVIEVMTAALGEEAEKC